MGAVRAEAEAGAEWVGGGLLAARVHRRIEGGRDRAALLWRAGPGWRMAASGVMGGGLARRDYVLNAEVDGDYRRTDPAAHLAEIAAGCGVSGDGVGLLTAADVTRACFAEDGGVEVLATVGIGRPTWAAADRALDEARIGAPLDGNGPGTINIIVAVPAALSDAALVNLVATATEAKVQALLENGYACTGTASDAVCAAGLVAGVPESAREPFGGVRSRWGARAARAVHAAVAAGARDRPPA
ncbi:adenosylcobinamide amidohydrolase [Actinorugispora endophytica]|uniref:Adenosylcobinamide amidohydrolase n=1 Tax=Actinorugispora endophytica TaxID=1605990 RepID=A0A4R6ULG6_9ACTN|nr:adenosylcobinamide amidohydrolase [Actinorugispora endophytica]TDQ45985.1 adenosylcobinamide amidohydrolase [Actinorugispora endophytica]